MIFIKYPDGKTYPARDMLDVFEEMIQKAKDYKTLVERFSFRISNGLQI